MTVVGQKLPWQPAKCDFRYTLESRPNSDIGTGPKRAN